MKDPNYEPKQFKAWEDFQKTLKEVKRKLSVLSAYTPGGVHEHCWEALDTADLWSR